MFDISTIQFIFKDKKDSICMGIQNILNINLSYNVGSGLGSHVGPSGDKRH